ncbi:predicted protein [Plenodomus lingam JN3]|uniref:Uncharacterized protein n=1 Tax=Leptosphaeria maculans (strain JN3 / isolate v23.1.3 / race Av1-4-5-6-7-8) TaxID=985895 RepID=M1ZIR8_LEPMJ|nr:predicted protein [Plenodomus lingam JN3]
MTKIGSRSWLDDDLENQQEKAHTPAHRDTDNVKFLQKPDSQTINYALALPSLRRPETSAIITRRPHCGSAFVHVL